MAKQKLRRRKNFSKLKKIFKLLKKKDYSVIINIYSPVTKNKFKNTIKGNKEAKINIDQSTQKKAKISINFDQLANDISLIDKQLTALNLNGLTKNDMEHWQNAKIAAENKDERKFVRNIKAIGEWLLEFSSQVGANYISTLLS